MKMEKNPISKVCTSNQGEDTHGLTPWSRSSKDAEESFTGDGLLHHMDTDTMHRLQMQVLQDEEFADDMRALLLARFRAKHRSNSDKQDLSLHDTSESSDSEEELEASKESSAVSKDVERLKALGYVLGPHEKLLLKGEILRGDSNKMWNRHFAPTWRFISGQLLGICGSCRKKTKRSFHLFTEHIRVR